MGGLFTSPGQLALEGRLAILVAERALLADEVANVDTPGYQPGADAAFAQALAQAAAAELGAAPPAAGSTVQAGPAPGVELSAAAVAGWAAPGGALPPTGAVPDLLAMAAAGAVTPDANGVDLDAAMVNLAETDLDYQAVARQLQLTYQNLQTAIDAGGA